MKPTEGMRAHWAGRESRLELGRQWPIWAFALMLYAASGLFVLTKFRVPSPVHLVVFVMAVAVMLLTAFKIEWGVLFLALILPFGRPGVSLGSMKLFQISAFNFALVGICMAYFLRYITDHNFASLGPFLRSSRLDRLIAAFLCLIVLSNLRSLNYVESNLEVSTFTLVYMKELLLYFVWFYLLLATMRTPDDLRRLVVAFAIAGFISSMMGLSTRLSGGGAAVTQGTMTQNLAEGAGGRIEGAGGGWFGLGHPNMFAALLLMTVPIWFFSISQVRSGFRRGVAGIAAASGFIGLLLTYSRSAWLGTAIGVGLVGFSDKKTLRWLILLLVLFAILAQIVLLVTMGLNLTEVVVNRMMQLRESGYSGRPDIFRQTLAIIRDHPLLGVGQGGFSAHAPPSPKGEVYNHAHNAFLQQAASTGIPSAVLFVVFWVQVLVIAVRNARRIGQVPGYGFMALGTAAALISITAQAMVVQIFYHRILGFAYYTLAAIVVALDRMIAEGQFEKQQGAAGGGQDPVPTGPSVKGRAR